MGFAADRIPLAATIFCTHSENNSHRIAPCPKKTGLGHFFTPGECLLFFLYSLIKIVGK